MPGVSVSALWARDADLSAKIEAQEHHVSQQVFAEQQREGHRTMQSCLLLKGWSAPGRRAELLA